MTTIEGAAEQQRPLSGLVNDELALRQIVERLQRDFDQLVSPAVVERCVFESYVTLARSSRVTPFLVSRAERFATDRLTALGQSAGTIAHPVPEVLFACSHNSGRSQLAAGLLSHHAQGRVHVRSAGSTPAEDIQQEVVMVLEERGIATTGEFPKPLTEDVIRAADVVITMSCGEHCPTYIGQVSEDWPIPDPHGLDLAAVRTIADQLEERVLELLGRLNP